MFDILKKEPAPALVCIVAVDREKYISQGRLVEKVRVRTLKRLSTFDLLADELSSVGQDIDIVNLNEVDTGKYQLITYDHSYDIESGYLDDWKLKLIPYKENEDET